MPVAIATCTNPGSLGANDDRVLIAALGELGVTATPAIWDDPTVDWGAHDAVVVRTTWDYDTRRDQFVGWAAEVEATTPLWNPADVVRWNTHKGYLIELEERGVPVVPTAWLARGDEVDLHMLAHSRRWDEGVVIKPAVGAGSRGVVVIDTHPGDGQTALDALLLEGDALVQPYLQRVGIDGERYLVCVEGRFSHAILKLPRHGDRGGPSHGGGSHVPDSPPDDLVALAEWAVDITGHDLLYARVDLVPGDDGTWQVGELEATEPLLYLDRCEGAAARLARAIANRLHERA